MYNGWKNRETWNVALWLANDYGLYHLAQRFRSYTALAEYLSAEGINLTGDNVSYQSRKLDRRALTAMIKEL